MNEEELIQKFNSGDERAFEVIFKMLYRWAFFLITNVIGHNNNQYAESEVLRIMQNVFKRRQSFINVYAIRKFVFVCAQYSAKNFINKRHRTVYDTDACNDLLDQQADEEAYEEQQTAALARLMNAIEQLKGNQKKVVQMLYYENLTPEQIAKALNMSTQTVYVHKNRAKEVLIKLLVENYIPTGSTYNKLKQK